MGGDGAWTAKDRAITLAYTMYEAMLCPECGHPYKVCRDPETDFEVHEDTCQAKAALDTYRRAQTGEPDEGLLLSVRVDDTPSVARPPWEQD